MSDPTPSNEQLRHDLEWADDWIPPHETRFGVISTKRLSAALDELATLRARVAELAAWRERAESVMQALTQMCESVVVNARDPELALKFLDDVIEELGPTAYALLGEGGLGE